jgi:hypothetical protein
VMGRPEPPCDADVQRIQQASERSNGIADGDAQAARERNC